MTTTVQLNVAYFSQFHTMALVDDGGYALYIFRPDNGKAVTCTGTCALDWPPVTVPAGTRPAVGRGVQSSLLGTDIEPGDTSVVTYRGWPLYSYTEDIQPGIANGQGIDVNGGFWYLMRPDGIPLLSVP